MKRKKWLGHLFVPTTPCFGYRKTVRGITLLLSRMNLVYAKLCSMGNKLRDYIKAIVAIVKQLLKISEVS